LEKIDELMEIELLLKLSLIQKPLMQKLLEWVCFWFLIFHGLLLPMIFNELYAPSFSAQHYSFRFCYHTTNFQSYRWQAYDV